MEIKLEPNSGQTCIICLRNDLQILGQHEIKYEILSTYKELLKDHVLKLNQLDVTEMCSECIETINGIAGFKRKCVNSIEILSMKSKIVQEGLTPPMTDIKEEIFVATLPVQVEMMEKKTPKKRPRKPSKEKTINPKKIKKRNSHSTDLDVKVDTKKMNETGHKTTQKLSQSYNVSAKIEETVTEEASKLYNGNQIKKRQKKLTGKTFTCHFCGLCTKYRASLAKHMSIYHTGIDENKTTFPKLKGKSGNCYICCIEYPNIRRHVIEFHTRVFEDGVIRCVFCEEILSDVEVVLEHLFYKHREYDSPKNCGQCNMQTKSREELTKHARQVHYVERKLLRICDFCDAVCFGGARYKNHIYSHLGAIRCKYCVNTFFNETEYKKHIEEHEKKIAETKLMCDFCGYSINTKYRLSDHIFRNHVTTREIKCNLCANMYITEAQLRHHFRMKHTVGRLQCVQCGLNFHTKTDLTLHDEQKHKGLPYKYKKKRPATREFACDHCDMKFYQKQSLQKHQHTHTKTRPFPCHMCAMGYYRNDYLRNHYLRAHDVMYSPKQIRKMCGLKKVKGDDDSD